MYSSDDGWLYGLRSSNTPLSPPHTTTTTTTVDMFWPLSNEGELDCRPLALHFDYNCNYGF